MSEAASENSLMTMPNFEIKLTQKPFLPLSQSIPSYILSVSLSFSYSLRNLPFSSGLSVKVILCYVRSIKLHDYAPAYAYLLTETFIKLNF